MAKIKKIRRKMMRPVEAFAVYSVLYFVKILTLRGARRFASLLGALVLLIPSQKKLVLANLKLAFPEKNEKERFAIASQSVRNLAKTFIEFLWFYKNDRKLRKHIHISDEFKNAYFKPENKGKPIIFLAMHWGNWELGSYGYSMIESVQDCIVARKFKNPFIEKLITEGREFCGTEILHEKGAARGIVKALKENKSVGMLVDQNTKTHQGGTYVNFFGLPVTISKMPAKLAFKMKTKVMLANCKRTPEGFDMCLDVLPKEVNEYDSEEELLQAMMTLMEKVIRECPEQWVWLYNRWNYIPKNWAARKDEFPYYAVVDERLEFDG